MPVLPVRERHTTLFFAGSAHLRPRWATAMRRQGPPICRTYLLDIKNTSRKKFNLTAIELGYSESRMSLNPPGHVGPRKAMFDSIRCGALPVIVNDILPVPFSDEIDYNSFSVRIPERAEQMRTFQYLNQLPLGELEIMQQAMEKAAFTLDYRRGLVDAALRQIMRGRTTQKLARKFRSARTTAIRLHSNWSKFRCAYSNTSLATREVVSCQMAGA